MATVLIGIPFYGISRIDYTLDSTGSKGLTVLLIRARAVSYIITIFTEIYFLPTTIVIDGLSIKTKNVHIPEEGGTASPVRFH